jgi:hypothetical protein
MEVLLQGKFTTDQDMLEVLNDVLALPGSSVGILRISNPQDQLNGRLTLYKRRYVIGATISDSAETGYQALRRLLAVRTGNFAYMETGQDEPPSDLAEPLCLDLPTLLEHLPDLPETLPAASEAHDVLPSSAIAVNGLKEAIEAVRHATNLKTDEIELPDPTKLRAMKRGIRWSKVAVVLVLLGGIAAGVNYSWPYVMSTAQEVMAKRAVAQVPTASANASLKQKPPIRSRHRPRHH